MRIAAGYSQRDMAQRIGIALNALVNAEEGRAIRGRTARKIADHWERSLGELFPERPPLALDVPVHTAQLLGNAR